MNRYTTTSRNSYGSRVGWALKWLIFWPILIFVAVWLLWWNEWRAVQRAQDLNFTEQNLVALQTPVYNPENDGNLVHTRGQLEGWVISDPVFSINMDGILLERVVEMYQWQETEREQRQDNLWWSETVTITYEYNEVWSERPINSSNFNQAWTYVNPSMPKTSQEFLSSDIGLWDFTLSDYLKNTLTTTTELSPTEENMIEWYSLEWKYLYRWEDINNPQIGDVRVSFRYLPTPTEISILAGQSSWALLDDYQAQNSSISRIMYGNHSSETMFEVLRSENNMLTWFIRGAWFVLLFAGFSIFFSIIPIIAAVVPIFKSILGFWVGLISFVLALIVWLTVIIIAWIFVRPLVAAVAIIVIAGLVYALIQRKKSTKPLVEEVQSVS